MFQHCFNISLFFTMFESAFRHQNTIKMAKSHSIIFQRRKKQDKEGVLTLRTIEDRKKTDKSLGIKLHESLWNDNTQQVRKTDKVDYESINKELKKVLADLEKEPVTKEKKIYVKKVHVPEVIANPEKSFIVFVQKLMLTHRNTSTRKKHGTFLNTITRYRDHLKLTDIYCSQWNKDFISAYKNFMLDNINLKLSTANRYVIVLKTTINKIMNEDYWSYPKHPFQGVITPREGKKEELLTTDEFRKIFNCTSDNIQECKRKFLFQVFAQGMRVSDLVLLKYSNIVKGRIEYTMFKTKQRTSVLLNENLIILLAYQILNDRVGEEFEEFQELEEAQIQYENYFIDNPITVKFGNEILDKWKKIKPSLVEDIEDRIEKEKADQFNEQLNILRYNRSGACMRLLDKITTSDIHRKLSVFHMTKIDFNDMNILDPREPHFNALGGASAVYNKQLKVLQKEAKIACNLTSHQARYGYTNLLLDSGGDIYDISKSLNHSSLSITEGYLQTFNIKKIDGVNQKLADDFRL